MSICTRTGDDGTTALLYNRRVPKTHPRIEACGAVDELNSALGLARSSPASATDQEFITPKLLQIQKQLVDLMGELATDKEDLARFVRDGFKIVTADFYTPLENWIKEIEAQKISFKGWATPGATPQAAALDLARSIARRAERRVEELLESSLTENRHLQVYLNRLSDFLWLLARRAEGNVGTKPEA